jgi:hypothetical protein
MAQIVPTVLDEIVDVVFTLINDDADYRTALLSRLREEQNPLYSYMTGYSAFKRTTTGDTDAVLLLYGVLDDASSFPHITGDVKAQQHTEELRSDSTAQYFSDLSDSYGRENGYLLEKALSLCSVPENAQLVLGVYRLVELRLEVANASTAASTLTVH